MPNWFTILREIGKFASAANASTYTPPPPSLVQMPIIFSSSSIRRSLKAQSLIVKETSCDTIAVSPRSQFSRRAILPFSPITSLSTSLRPTLPHRFLATQPPQNDPNQRVDESDHRSPNESHNAFQFDSATFLILSATLLGALACCYVFKDYFGPREREILQHRIDLEHNPHHGYIVNSNDFEFVAPKPTGELSGSIVKNKNTGKLYLKKGAKTKDALVREFLISNFLALVRPGEQPPSLIMQEVHSDGQAQLYTLSEIFPHSMDIQQFILTHSNYADLFKLKPLVGFDAALASDHIFAEQSDLKFANLIIIEKEDAYVVATIDHEMSGKGPRAKCVFTDNPNKLIRSIRDIDSTLGANDEDPSCFIDSSLAQDFATDTKPYMSRNGILGFYSRVGGVDLKEFYPVIDSIQGIDGIISDEEKMQYISEFNKIIQRARQFVVDAYVSQSPATALNISVPPPDSHKRVIDAYRRR